MENPQGQALLVLHEFVGGSRSVVDTLGEIASLAITAVDAEMAGLSLNDSSGRTTTAAHTDQAVPDLDQAQYDAGDGPCLHAFRSREVVVVDEIGDDGRWPTYRDAAVAHGIHSSLSIPVWAADTPLGALNFYDSRPSHFGREQVAAGEVFGRHAAIVAAYFERVDAADNLQRAMESRATIEQAKGVIMATMGCSAEDAFGVLRVQSQNENRKLRDVAAELVERQQRTNKP